MDSSESQTIVVTGFGLFRDHKSNPSWEAIRDGRLIIDRPNVKIVTKQIDVIYDEVDKSVQDLWNEHRPMLMVHLGLAAFEKSIRLERLARHGPYIHDDITQQAPHKELRLYPTDGDNKQAAGSLEENVRPHPYSCKPCSFKSTETRINIERVCSSLNRLHADGKVKIPFKCSDDAGLYLCEYIYQKSLRINNRAIFIHVPNTGDVYTLDDITVCIKHAIEFILDELNEI